MKTEALKQALDNYGFDAAFGGARRDEEASRAKERVFSFRSATSTAGTPRTSGPSSGTSTTRASAAASRSASSRSRTGPSSTSGSTSTSSRSRSCRSTSRSERPGRRARRHADHGRRRPHAARAGRGAEDAQRALPHARLLPAHAARSRATPTRCPRIIHEMLLARTSERQGRLIDHDESGLDGDEEAGGVLLMSVTDPPSTDSRTSMRYLAEQRAQAPAALHHLRQRRRRQEHADRPAAVRVAARLRRPARRARARLRARFGTQGGELDFALLLDGLLAEREQGITIDVAYRFFATERRKFIVADTPGHEQYTRNMVTGASTADAAVILVDARSGVLAQTRRHAYLLSLLGIRHVAVAVNKMDLVGYDEDDVPRDRARLPRASPRDRPRRRRRHPAVGAARRQRARAQRARCPGTTARR